MATKEETILLQALSEKVFGKKHEWKKLTKKGVPMLTGTRSRRYLPLTSAQAKDFMVKKLEERAKRDAAKDSK